ncbi:ATP-binding cassette domain-containing protein [Paracoccus aurantiacus]|uniref:ATP-binding cassette domain-containing protein n=1 Tax=Paracoccus aurantiacus TaxID=2599412 RepID=A0A5C6S7W8_9RHOB|nr:ATP-binding cassette domain-containing protein [Paracoccus aurantiacus]TXB70611.1 ATP-binding cassette domain-containing protein [Paracoccus aurantiacus]
MKARLDGATLGYGAKPVLSGVDFTLNDGERVVLLGPSGAGKSTLLAAIYRQMTKARTRVALVPQDHGLVPQLSVRRNVYMGRLDDHSGIINLGRLIHLPQHVRDGIDAILLPLGLSEFATRPVEALSGGQRQRTALGRALYRGGEVIVADEPVSAVDAVQSRDIMSMIAARFPTALIALHDIDLARLYATRIIGLKDGRVRFDAETKKVSDAQIEALYA